MFYDSSTKSFILKNFSIKQPERDVISSEYSFSFDCRTIKDHLGSIAENTINDVMALLQSLDEKTQLEMLHFFTTKFLHHLTRKNVVLGTLEYNKQKREVSKTLYNLKREVEKEIGIEEVST